VWCGISQRGPGCAPLNQDERSTLRGPGKRGAISAGGRTRCPPHPRRRRRPVELGSLRARQDLPARGRSSCGTNRPGWPGSKSAAWDELARSCASQRPTPSKNSVRRQRPEPASSRSAAAREDAKKHHHGRVELELGGLRQRHFRSPLDLAYAVIVLEEAHEFIAGVLGDRLNGAFWMLGSWGYYGVRP